MALPGLGRALVSAGKLGQKAAEDLYKKAQSGRTTFIAELTGSGAVSAYDLAHTMSTAFAAPLLDLDAIDVQRLPKDLLDAKICADFRIVVLSKRNNRLMVATADPADQQAAEKIKFEYWYGLTGDLGAVVAETCNRFNASQDQYEAVCVGQDGYEKAVQNTIAAFRAGKHPTLLQSFDAGTADLRSECRPTGFPGLIQGLAFLVEAGLGLPVFGRQESTRP